MFHFSQDQRLGMNPKRPMTWKGKEKAKAKIQKYGCENLEFSIFAFWEVSVLRSWSKVKLHRAVLLGFSLKELKIAPNIVKFGLHCYLLNVHLDLWSNFKTEKLVKSETPLLQFSQGWGERGWKQLATSWKLECTLVYQMGIQICDQISIRRN